MGIPINWEFPPTAAKTVNEPKKDTAIVNLDAETTANGHSTDNYHFRRATELAAERMATRDRSSQLQRELRELTDRVTRMRRLRQNDAILGTGSADEARRLTEFQVLEEQVEATLLRSRVQRYRVEMPSLSEAEVRQAARESLDKERWNALERNLEALHETFRRWDEPTRRIEDRRDAIAAPGASTHGRPTSVPELDPPLTEAETIAWGRQAALTQGGERPDAITGPNRPQRVAATSRTGRPPNVTNTNNALSSVRRRISLSRSTRARIENSPPRISFNSAFGDATDGWGRTRTFERAYRGDRSPGPRDLFAPEDRRRRDEGLNERRGVSAVYAEDRATMQAYLRHQLNSMRESMEEEATDVETMEL